MLYILDMYIHVHDHANTECNTGNGGMGEWAHQVAGDGGGDHGVGSDNECSAEH